MKFLQYGVVLALAVFSAAIPTPENAADVAKRDPGSNRYSVCCSTSPPLAQTGNPSSSTLLTDVGDEYSLMSRSPIKSPPTRHRRNEKDTMRDRGKFDLCSLGMSVSLAWKPNRTLGPGMDCHTFNGGGLGLVIGTCVKGS
jgi:hypothetical protein